MKSVGEKTEGKRMFLTVILQAKVPSEIDNFKERHIVKILQR